MRKPVRVGIRGASDAKGAADGIVHGQEGTGPGGRQRLQHRLGDQPQAPRRGGRDRLHPPAGREDGAPGPQAGRPDRRQARHLLRRPEGRGRRPGLRRGPQDLRHARFRAPLDRLRADRRHQGAVRQLQPRRLQDGHGHQRLLAGHRLPSRGRVDAQRRRDRHADVLRRRAGRLRVQPDGRVQGRARRRGAVPGLRPRARSGSASTPSPPAL